MNTRQLADLLGISYTQLDYLIRKKAINPSPVRQGESRNFSYEDIWAAAFAAALLRVGISVSLITKIMNSRDIKEIFLAQKVSSSLYVLFQDGKKAFVALWDNERESWTVGRNIVDALDMYIRATKITGCLFYSIRIRNANVEVENGQGKTDT